MVRLLCSGSRSLLSGVWSAVRVSWRPTPTGLAVPGALVIYHFTTSTVHCKNRAGPPPGPAAATRLLVPAGRGKSEELPFNWWKLWEFLSPDLLLLIGATASAVATALLNISIPLELGALVTLVSQLQANLPVADYVSILAPSALKLAGLYLTQGVFTFCYISILSVVGERFAVRLRSTLFQSLIQQDMAFFDRHRTGELINRLSADVQELKSSFKLTISQGLRSAMQIVGCLASLYYISPQMTGVVFVIVPSMVAMGTVIGSVLRRWSTEAQEQVAIATSVADEAISNVRTVRAFAMENNETRLYSEQLVKAKAGNTKLGLGIAVFQGLSNIAINGLVLAVMCQGGLLLSLSAIAPGDLMAFLVATQTIQKSLGSLSMLFGQVVRGVSAGSRVMEFMHTAPAVPLVGGVVLDKVKGQVEFHNVSFAYPARPDQVVLSDFSLSLPAGKVTALCGLSGAGKSTIASLLERFYEPVSGHVTLDKRPLDQLDPSWLRGEVIGFINQEPVLFATSVRENIRYGRPSATDQEVVAAARLANAHSFISQFPEGYSTTVGERGVALSGGQKQRVAIARALLKDPSLLILDEATSALDAQSESLVQQALERACQGRTVLIIAHRLSTIREADQIAVLHRGQLREVGTHAELVKRGGIYSELIRRQTMLN